MVGSTIMSQAPRCMTSRLNRPLKSGALTRKHLAQTSRQSRFMHRFVLGGCRYCAPIKNARVAQLCADFNERAYVFRLAQVAERRDAKTGDVRGI